MKIPAMITLWLLTLPLSLKAAGEAAPVNIVSAARCQIGCTLRYDPSYQKLDYPGGDVPIAGGVCSDVVVRALRASMGMDLQKLVHEDMTQHFSSYPQQWGLRQPDKNIDHRRVPNLQIYFKRKGYELPVSTNPADYKAGDLVTCIVPQNLPHIMIVSDRSDAAGCPLVIHNIGGGAQEEDRLFEFKITGHYRIKPIALTCIFHTHFNDQPICAVTRPWKDTHYAYAGYCKTASK
ncbi:MAG: DUF1287 domain-containing protein [Methylacidiphilales bacterium]|nr:DUF1287 domain-containing protein [Candidatus Methylacidiphilales bacterium]